MIDLIGATVLLIGASIVLIGAVGLLRFPDFYCRLHSAGVIDMLGAGTTLLGLLLLAGTLVVAAKIVMMAMLIFFLSPVVTHALAKSALQFENRQPESGQSVSGIGQDIKQDTLNVTTGQVNHLD